MTRRPHPELKPQGQRLPVRLLTPILALLCCAPVRAQQPREPSSSSCAPAPPSAVDSPPPTAADGNFFARLARFYRGDWSGAAATTPAAPAPQKRGYPSPLDSPPFPSSDWSYGGSQEIGAPDSNVYPLMTAINGAASRTKIYGWVEPSVNFSTSGHTNLPQSYDHVPNMIALQQAFVFVERLADTVQTKHFDYGYHLTALYGLDYMDTTGKGYFSQQLLKYNRQYGYDLPIEYVDLYFPHVAQGMDLRVGRYSGVPGIEAQYAPSNYIFSHSLLSVYDPFTDTGALATIKLNDRWLVQTGITDGHDIAPWATGAKASGNLCLDYTTPSIRNNFYLCAAGINSGRYAYDNVQHYDATWYHKFSSTWHMASELWYMYQRDVPNASTLVVHPIAPLAGTSGAICDTTALRCTAPAYAADNYLEKKLSPTAYLSFRSEYFDDQKGQRTGFATKYTENTLSVGKWIGSTILLRPEMRFDHSWDATAYNGGRSRNQFTLASDLVYRF
jgi:hypothetical protein